MKVSPSFTGMRHVSEGIGVFSGMSISFGTFGASQVPPFNW